MLTPFRRTPSKTQLCQAVGRQATDNEASLVVEDDTSLAAFIISQTVDSVMHACSWQRDNLQRVECEVVWLLINTLNQRLSRILDYSPGVVRQYASMWIFRDDPKFIFGDTMHTSRHYDARCYVEKSLYKSLESEIDTWLADLELTDVSSLSHLVLAISCAMHADINHIHTAHTG